MPRQRLLEGLGEIEEAPADDDIVVESHEEAHLQARDASQFQNHLSGSANHPAGHQT